GVLHRDLKPGNVMVGAFGEVQVMDWGLAKALARGRKPPEDQASPGAYAPRSPTDLREETHVGDILGTPAYMPPEQALSQIGQLDERADVFGLGAILCVLLTGQPPYVASRKADVYHQAARGDLADAFARLDACGADAELVTLAKVCLASNREERP